MADADVQHMVVCRVGSERFALPVSAVREVVAGSPVTPLPGAPAAVRGLANVHGVLVTVVSAPLLLGLSSGPPCEWLIVLTMHGSRVGIEVDEVEDLSGTGQESESLRALDLDMLIRPLLSGPDS